MKNLITNLTPELQAIQGSDSVKQILDNVSLPNENKNKVTIEPFVTMLSREKVNYAKGVTYID